jgi:hypothetical protein
VESAGGDPLRHATKARDDFRCWTHDNRFDDLDKRLVLEVIS